MRGLYVHIPFCVKKCAYCDFVSFPCGDRAEYIAALKRELDEWCKESVDSIFIGGGTPTSLDSGTLGELFLHIANRFPDVREFTVEANPKTLDAEKLKIMKKAGVNRVSVGVQSFNDAELRRIGRIHSAEDAKNTIKLLREHGFANINIDLMSALPMQTLESFSGTLKTAIGLNVEHISCYSLILEEGTPLYNEHMSRPLPLPDEDTEREMYAYAQKALADAGYIQYEISNYAKPGYECMHNLKYWHCEEYIGVGLAAHSYVNGERFANTSDMQSYLGGKRVEERISLSKEDMCGEYIIMALRLREGVNCADFYNRFGKDFYKSYQAVNDKFLKLGLLERTSVGFRLTNEGINLSNSVMCEYL